MYRTASPPPANRILLEEIDQKRVALVLAIFFGALGVLFVGTIGSAVVLPREHRDLGRLVVVAVVSITIIGALVAMRGRMKKLLYFLELVDGGARPRLRLLAPNGAMIADTENGSLAITRVNYVRAGRHGQGWLRPGFLVQHAAGRFVVGTLYPQLPWDGVGHANEPGRPDFELGNDEHEALAARVPR